MTGLCLALGTHPARAAGQIELCLARHPVENSFVQNAAAHGPIHVPAGTALNYAGHAFGPASDPLDRAHAAPDGDGWRDIPPAEEARRRDLQMEDIGGDSRYHRPQAALMTTAAVTLSPAHPCAQVGATALLSDDWTWTMDTIPARPDMYFQAYGTVRGNQLDPTFNNDADPFQWTAAHGALNAIVTQTVDQSLTLRSPD
ncbi:hypothetical protein HNW77_15120 [Komagataeibacter sp. AV436]|uniref:Uncharacterized protein n=1 Tax=Komagataeibacter melomenusus TaxID=2766578 RepID=A0ABX2AIL3_9PROT|nr:hypothetical protein [Komagataeibacter melomenusus]MBV1831877.1 hypothetical protein [Komagataeibacter melomenusus]NPC67687.1 hypothetical protein [Komagataeibacter melomenusus]